MASLQPLDEQPLEVSDFTPRDYQIELFQNSLEDNIIVYLPTGSGKTFIAASLIKEKAHEVAGSLRDGSKRTVFLVPTVVLAIQQAAYLRRHTHLNVQEYYGSMGVDFWEKERWLDEFEKNQVLVMTAQVLADILNHAFYSVNRINLLILDECHAAVKDSPMKQVLSKLATHDISERPKILGLTAALFRRRCKPHQVDEIIQKLSETMNSTVKLPTDFESVYRNSTKPCEIIFEYADNGKIENADARFLIEMIGTEAMSLREKFNQRYPKSNQESEQTNSDEVVKPRVLVDALDEMLYLLNSFGPYGAFRSAIIYSNVFQRVKGRVVLPQFRSDLDKVTTLCDQIRNSCEEVFNKYSSLDRLVLFVNPRILRLLEILRQFNPSDDSSYNAVKICGIIFVERRCMANILCHFLQEIAKCDPRLDFLKPLFTMGRNASFRSLIKDSHILNLRQKEVIKEFCEGICNLLVATSVLEEGIDVPACNVIIRFDEIKTYCDYVQTKGRARARKAFFFLLVPSVNLGLSLENITDCHAIEQVLLSKSNFEEDDGDNVFDDACDQLIPPYVPFGYNGPRVTMQSAMSLINRYCGQLSSGAGISLAPNWTLTKIERDQVDPIWLERIYGAIQEKKNDLKSLFQCSLILPLNSPLREEIVGEIMPSKRLAKRAVALKTCIRLHEMKELTDTHLFPVQIELEDSEEEDEEKEVGASQVPKRGDIFERSIPSCFTDCRPLAHQQSYVYSINFHVIQPSNDLRKIYLPFCVNTKLAILSSRTIPAVCPFPLFTRAGEFQVEVVGTDSIILDEKQLELMEQFHQIIFQDVIYMRRTRLEFDPELAKLQFLIVPLKRIGGKLDFCFAERIVNAPKVEWDEAPRDSFKFDARNYNDAVVMPRYRPPNNSVISAYYVDLVSELIPASPFPEKNFKNFIDYYHKKYKLTVSDPNQNLLLVSREITGKNYLIQRNTTVKEKDQIHLVPEFCYLHPLPASVWKQVVWIPSALHRLTGLLVAEELRVRISRDTKMGVEFLPGDVNIASVWRSLDVSRSSDSPLNEDPRLLLHSSDKKVTRIEADSIGDELDLMWHVEYSDVIEENVVEMTNGQITPIAQVSDDLIKEPSSWMEKRMLLSFDEARATDLLTYGPSPGLVLEALTLTRCKDGFDMERLETIGDSILKLAITIYAYGETATKCAGEGRLSQMRMQQINNKHLHKIGLKKGLGEIISGVRFDVTSNFLPPAFKTPDILADEEMNSHIQQLILTKNVADTVEALLGVYLLSMGIKGVLTLMDWLDLKTIPSMVEERNEKNGFPLLQVLENKEDSAAVEHLYVSYGLESLERRLNYTFKNKSLLVEALTHASYSSNRVTNCYQRLEFLGDAVLDYLITRYFYDDPRQFSPAMLTDLRSATVNNETFAVVAVRNRFHLHLARLSLPLDALIDSFVKSQEENGHLLLHDRFVLEEMGDADERLASNVDVPKVLGDIFESVAGAIFFDSGMSLDCVWKSYLPFLHEEMEKFDRNVPISALRVLHERFQSSLKFKKAQELMDGRICVSLEIEGSRIFKGAGGNTKTAKTAAAKYALCVMNEQKQSSQNVIC